MSAWDAKGYDDHFGFVTAFGGSLLDLLDPRPGERVLDLGCGTGHHAAELVERGCTVVGVDADPAMVSRARALHDDLAAPTFVVADAQDPRFPERLREHGPFDAVVSNAALHWMTDVTATLANVRAVLRPGGRFVAEQGGSGNVRRVRDAIAAALVDLGADPAEAEAAVSARSWFPTVGQESAALEAAGFEVLLMELFERPTQLPDGTTVSSWAAMFRPWVADVLPAERRRSLAARIDNRARRMRLQHLDDSWWVDYVRLRFVATAA